MTHLCTMTISRDSPTRLQEKEGIQHSDADTRHQDIREVRPCTLRHDRLSALQPVNADEAPRNQPARRSSRAQPQAVFGACFSHDLEDMSRPTAGLLSRWMVEDEWKLIVPVPGRNSEDVPDHPLMYRITEDSDERRDLAAERPEQLRVLRRKLDEWWSPDRTRSRKSPYQRSPCTTRPPTMVMSARISLILSSGQVR